MNIFLCSCPWSIYLSRYLDTDGYLQFVVQKGIAVKASLDQGDFIQILSNLHLNYSKVCPQEYRSVHCSKPIIWKWLLNVSPKKEKEEGKLNLFL